MAAKITRGVLEGYLHCTFKGRLRLAGVAGEESDYQKLTGEDEAQARARATAQLLTRHPEGQACRGASLTPADLARGTPLLLDATIEDEHLSLRCDGLLKVEGASRLGDHHYAPILCRATPTSRRETKLLLAVLGLVLGAIQGKQPAAGLVVCGPGCSRTKVKLTAKLNRPAGDILEALKQMQAGQNGPTLTLNDHCCQCEFRRRCHAEATAKDDLSLLRVLSEAELRKHRKKDLHRHPTGLHLPPPPPGQAGQTPRPAPPRRAAGPGPPRRQDLHPG
jgi:predicted RecB family nuclease